MSIDPHVLAMKGTLKYLKKFGYEDLEVGYFDITAKDGDELVFIKVFEDWDEIPEYEIDREAAEISMLAYVKENDLHDTKLRIDAVSVRLLKRDDSIGMMIRHSKNYQSDKADR